MKGHAKADGERGRLLRAARRLIVKVGTTTVTGAEGELCAERVEPIARSIAALMKSGRQVVLVSSGAVGLGRGWLGLHRSRLNDMATKQACAAVGQSLLMNAYKAVFAAWDVKVAQVLLTEGDFTEWRRYSNLRHTIEKLLGFGVLPIVNENDTVSTAELETIAAGAAGAAGASGGRAGFSDNDRLAALVMSGLEADALILLTNVDGLLRRSDSGAPAAIPLVEQITPELRALALGASAGGRGGMQTKLDAAEIAMKCGGTAVIANGGSPHVLERILDGERAGTAFLPAKRINGKRRWIAYAAGVRGKVVVDAGAHRAITQGKASLLASGIVRIENHFAPMDVVSILDGEGREFARGIANCASQDAGASRVLVNRDNIVLMESL
ncbi:MAG TPA: glutamate 5-kinase [Candidatus Acidoferrales bacterium]|nr:glutamate 5-kinase [Candidatus Acidoferrales bacterium]